MAKAKAKATAKATKAALSSVSTSLPQSSDVPAGMMQMGGGYANTWTPVEIGDSIHGIVTTQPKPLTLNKGTKKENNTRVMEVTDMEGDRQAVWDSAVLNELFDTIEAQASEGEFEQEIYIRYDGLGKKKPGHNPPKLFSVFMSE